jgi:hypothetical protein
LLPVPLPPPLLLLLLLLLLPNSLFIGLQLGQLGLE